MTTIDAVTQVLGVISPRGGAQRLAGVRGHRRPVRRSTVVLLVVALMAGGTAIGLFGSAWQRTYGHQDAVQSHQDTLEDVWGAGAVSTQELFGSLVAGAAAEAVGGVPKPFPGSAIARLWIPALNLHWVVVQGTASWDIASAPGHYSFSALPGEKGNFAVAGHRSPGIFWDLDRLRAGDEIIVETRHGTFIYNVMITKITSPKSWAEVSSNPPGFPAGSRVLTLTTCNPKWDNYERLVVHAKYVKRVDSWVPPAG